MQKIKLFLFLVSISSLVSCSHLGEKSRKIAAESPNGEETSERESELSPGFTDVYKVNYTRQSNMCFALENVFSEIRDYFVFEGDIVQTKSSRFFVEDIIPFRGKHPIRNTYGCKMTGELKLKKDKEKSFSIKMKTGRTACYQLKEGTLNFFETINIANRTKTLIRLNLLCGKDSSDNEILQLDSDLK